MEVLVAVAISLFMFVSFFAAISSGVVIVQASQEDLRATQIMENRMEGIRLFTWTQLTNTTLLPTNFTEQYYPPGTTGVNGNPGITYTGAVSVASLGLASPASSYSNNMCEVTIQLTWRSTGPLQTRQMSTCCAKYGIQNYVWTSD